MFTTSAEPPQDRPILAASIELSPTQIARKPEAVNLIPPATRVYIVDLGTMTPAEWSATARQLANLGLEPVPHIAARRLKSREELADRVKAMVEEVGVRDALLIAGGADAPVGPFTSSLDVLDTGILDRHGISRVAVAGHPEGNPDIEDDVIMQALTLKQAFAQRTDADMRIATQFGFNAAAVLKWVSVLEKAGIQLPVHLGVAGPTSVTNLLKYAAMCGVSASAGFLAKQSGAKVTSLLTNHSPEPHIHPIEEYVAAHPTGLIKQLHVFPFGGIAKTADWLCQRGSWNADARAAFEAMSESARQSFRNSSSAEGVA